MFALFILSITIIPEQNAIVIQEVARTDENSHPPVKASIRLLVQIKTLDY